MNRITNPQSNRDSTPKTEPDFVSIQVSEAKRYYLDLNPSLKDPMTVVCGGVELTQIDYEVRRDRFAYYGLELVAEGTGALELGSSTFPLSAGNVFSYGPTDQHRITNTAPNRMRKFYVDFVGADAENELSRAGLRDGRPLRVSRLHEIVELFEFLDREARTQRDLSAEVCQQILRLLLAKVRQLSIADGPATPRAYATFERVREFIERHHLEVQTVEEVAERCDITPIHLSRLFRRFGGVGAYRFLIRKKMNYAAELLLEEGLLIKEVAERLGFSDAFQFSRAFKRVYGIPPKQLVQTRSKK